MVVKLLFSGTTRDGIMRLAYLLTRQGNLNMPINRTLLYLTANFDISWLVQMYISRNKSSLHATTPFVKNTPLS